MGRCGSGARLACCRWRRGRFRRAVGCGAWWTAVGVWRLVLACPVVVGSRFSVMVRRSRPGNAAFEQRCVLCWWRSGGLWNRDLPQGTQNWILQRFLDEGRNMQTGAIYSSRPMLSGQLRRAGVLIGRDRDLTIKQVTYPTSMLRNGPESQDSIRKAADGSMLFCMSRRPAKMSSAYPAQTSWSAFP